MNTIFEGILAGKILLVNVNREGRINASFVTYNRLGEYMWLDDIDDVGCIISNYPFLIRYLQQRGFSLELSRLQGDVMLQAEIFSVERKGGYKESFSRIVHSRSLGTKCLDTFETNLAVQSQVYEFKNNSLVREL